MKPSYSEMLMTIIVKKRVPQRLLSSEWRLSRDLMDPIMERPHRDK